MGTDPYLYPCSTLAASNAVVSVVCWFFCCAGSVLDCGRERDSDVSAVDRVVRSVPIEVGAKFRPVASECVIDRDAAPVPHDRTCFQDRKPVGGKRTLIPVAEGPHACTARGLLLTSRSNKPRSKCSGCAWTKPFCRYCQ